MSPRTRLWLPGDIDLNSFQHGPFLQAFNEKNGTHLVSIGNTYLAPLRVYSNKITSIKDVPDGAKVSIRTIRPMADALCSFWTTTVS